MRKNDFDLPICLSIAKLTVEINFQTIKKKIRKPNKQKKSEKQNANYCTKGRKNIGESTVNRITKITQQQKCETHK